ncbi:MAG: hypothetical protein H0V82_12855 [Candidatus Protochlamydia sp.]|nr:hypothetical protein [Candidatus Protochlamydia sp.]
MKFSEITFEEYNREKIPVFIYFASSRGAIIANRCTATKNYFSQAYNQLDLPSQKKEVEKLVYEIKFIELMNNWIKENVVAGKTKIIVNILNKFRIESFLIIYNKSFIPKPKLITEINVSKISPFIDK